VFRYEAGRWPTLALLLGLTLAVVVFAAQCGPPASAAPTPRFCGEQRLFGYIRSLRKSGSQYLLRFDPAFFLSGVTANRAAAQDGVVPPGQPVPNDNYVVNESRRTYVYKVTPATRIRVLLRGGNITEGSRVSLATLASLVHGGHPVRLFEGFQSGFWLGVHIDRACSLEQQYRP
jgi:hypothetical protein